MPVSVPADYVSKNRDSWNKRTEVHISSAFYDLEGFLQGKLSLKSIELELLGEVDHTSVLHLMCHFGQDSISLARMGATVTGVDLSDTAIEKAREIAARAIPTGQALPDPTPSTPPASTRSGPPPTFIRCALYDLPSHLDQTFDTVFLSYGTIGWLPDLDRWGKIVARFLKPGGRLVFIEFHPFIWMFDSDFSKIAYSYFNVEPIIETMTGTYADRSAPITHENVCWNHPFSEVFAALLRNGLVISDFQEYDYSPYDCLPGLIEDEPEKYRFAGHGRNIPLVYSLIARKPDR